MKNIKFSYDGRSRPTNDLYSQNYDRIFNPTLTKNMPNVKWDQIPPVKGPNSQGIANEMYQVKTNWLSLLKKFPNKFWSKLNLELNHYQGLTLLLILLILVLG